MKLRGKFLAGYLTFWFIYFLFFKIVFLIYHSHLTSELSASTIAGIFIYGSWPDFSFSAILTVVPLILVILSTLIPPGNWLFKSMLIYTTIMLIIVTVLCSTDLELFRIWGFRLDSTPLMYLNTPTEMLISMGASPLLLLIILNTVTNLFFCFAYKEVLHPITKTFTSQKPHLAPVYLLVPILLVVLVWYEFRTSPIKEASSIYFSQNLFANQSAVNVPWNFFHSLRKRGMKKNNPYLFLEEAVADSLVQKLYPPQSAKTPEALTFSRPNIVLIIWESFTAKAAENLGGLPGITPAFQGLSREGLLFSRVYASGDRSDKGLVAILSGYPTQPAASILETEKKAQNLPHLAEALRKEGYATSFYYGGELEFANLKPYLLDGGFQELIGVEDFEKDQLNSKWGAHDHVVFKKLLEDIENRKGPAPFFKTVFTLSSHEPFDIPVESKFKENDVTSKFLSALYYTDSTVGHFIAEAKKRPWYDNTLFIILADHGHTYPGGSQVFETNKFHIPMLWLGGALKSAPAVVDYTMSQTDLAATLLAQLKVPSQDFRWSKDILNPQNPHFAHYFFKDGVGFVTDSSALSFDNVGKKMIESQGTTDSLQLKLARAYLQLSYGDYLDK